MTATASAPGRTPDARPAPKAAPATSGSATAVAPSPGYPAAPSAVAAPAQPGPEHPAQPSSAEAGAASAEPRIGDPATTHQPGSARLAVPAQILAPGSGEATLARHGTRQIATAAAEAPALKGGTPERIELHLDPPELGRVRMMLSLGEHGVTLHLIADRAETLDLLRRHIGLLDAEFARLGYGSADFSFGRGPGGDQQTAPADTGAEPTAAPAAMPAIAQTNAVAPGTEPRRAGLDLRL